MQKTGLIIGRGIYLDNDISALNYYRGRVALFAILKALNMGHGDQIAIQAFTCVAVPEAILAAGAQPIYVDIGPEGVNMDPADLDQKITSKTRAIIVQHTFGMPVAMDRIEAIAKQRNIPIIEDCCHTILSKYKSKKVGTFGVASFYSFEWGKPVVIGIGGSALVNDPVLGKEVERQYADYKISSRMSQVRLQIQYLSFYLLYRPLFFWPLRSMYHMLGSLGAAESNYNPIIPNKMAEDFSLKMTRSLQKRLTKKLMNLEANTTHSRLVATEYQKKIRSPMVTHPVIDDDSEVAFPRYPLLANDKPNLLKLARRANVEIADWYKTPIHPLSKSDWHHVNYQAGTCPNAENRCEQIVSLPVHQKVSPKDVSRIIEFFNNT